MDGETYPLRRVGGHPFQDETLEALVGEHIRGTGRLSGRTLFIREWEVVPAPDDQDTPPKQKGEKKGKRREDG